MKKSLIVFCFFFCFSITRAQDDGIARWRALFFAHDEGLPAEKALQAAKDRLRDAVEINDLQSEAHARIALGLVHLRHTHDYDTAVDHFIQSLTIAGSLDLLPEQIFSFIAIARVFEAVGNAPKAEEMLEDAQMLNRQLEDKHVEAIVLNALGKVNAAQGKMQEAFATYQQALQLMRGIRDPALEAEAVFNLANLYTRQGNYEQALEKHKRALVITRSARDRTAEALFLNEIGELYRLMGNTERAFANHTASLEIRTGLKDQKGIASSHNNLAVLYYHQHNFADAMAHLQTALSAARESQAQEEIRKAHEYLSLCYEAQGDYRKALENKDEFISINDFIQNEKTERQLLEAQNRYEIDLKQSRIRTLESIRQQRERELAEQKRFRDFLIAVIALGTVIVFLVIYLYFTIRRSNRQLKVAHARVQEQNLQLQELNATKDKFFSIIGHDLKGPLHSLTSFSGLLINHTDSLTQDEIRMLAKDLDKSLKNLFALLENLLEWSRSQTGNIDFRKEKFGIAEMVEENRSLLQGQAEIKKIQIENLSQEDFAVYAHRHSVNTVIRNLLSNAIKFTAQGGKVTLQARVVKHEVVVSVADSGVGMSAEVLKKLFRIDTKLSTKGTADEKGTGLGLILCKEFVEKNGGRIWVESTPGRGSIFSFSLPAVAGDAVPIPHVAVSA